MILAKKQIKTGKREYCMLLYWMFNRQKQENGIFAFLLLIKMIKGQIQRRETSIFV